MNEANSVKHFFRVVLLVIPPVVFATTINIATELPLKFNDLHGLQILERIEEVTQNQTIFIENLPSRFS